MYRQSVRQVIGTLKKRPSSFVIGREGTFLDMREQVYSTGDVAFHPALQPLAFRRHSSTAFHQVRIYLLPVTSQHINTPAHLATPVSAGEEDRDRGHAR